MSDTPLVPLEKPRLSRKRYLRRLLWGAAGLALLLVWASRLVFLGKLFKLRKHCAKAADCTHRSRDRRPCRDRLLPLESAETGMRGGWRCAAWARSGRRGAATRKVDPFALRKRAGIRSPRVLLRDLVSERPKVHLIVNRDGSTNQPQPPTKTETQCAEYALRSAGRSCGGRPWRLRLRRAF